MMPASGCRASSWSHTTKHVLTLRGRLRHQNHRLTQPSRPPASIGCKSPAALFRTDLQQNLSVMASFTPIPIPATSSSQQKAQAAGSWSSSISAWPAGLSPASARACVKRRLPSPRGTARRLVRAQQQLGLFLPSANLPLLERVEARVSIGSGAGRWRICSRSGVRRCGVVKEFQELLYTMPFHVPEPHPAGKNAGDSIRHVYGLNPQFNVLAL